MKKPFRLDRRNGVVMGVCAGVAASTGWNVNYVRLGMVVATITTFPWLLAGYGLAAWLAPKGAPSRSLYGPSEKSGSRVDRDRRITEIDRYAAGSNSRLAEEIERLR